MKRDFIPLMIGKIIGIIFIFLAYFLLTGTVLTTNSILVSIMFGLICYAFFLFGVGLLIPEIIDKNKFLNLLFSILWKPVLLLFFFRSVAAPIITVIAFTAFYITPTFATYAFFYQSQLLYPYTQGAIYIVAIISVLLFAYFGNKIMIMTIDSFKANFLQKTLIKITSRSYTRLYTYFLMVIIYLLFNFLTFSNITINSVPIEILNVTKEVFVTFVAVDTLIQIYLNNRKPVD